MITVCDFGSMKSVETVPCHCGKGTMEVEVLVFGIWKIEKLLSPCGSCGSREIQEARDALNAAKEK